MSELNQVELHKGIVLLDGLQLTSDERRALKQLVHKMKDLSPRQTSLNLKFSKNKDSYKAVLKVDALKIDIESTVFANSFVGLLGDVAEEFLEEIGKWKATRFQDAPVVQAAV